MSRVQGEMKVSVSYEPQNQGPLDARLVVDTQADLVDPKTYDSKNYYAGMTVSVKDDGSIWTLKDPHLLPSLDAWIKQSTGKGVQEIIITDNCTTENAEECLSARQGKLLKDEITEVKNDLAKNTSAWDWWIEPED